MTRQRSKSPSEQAAQKLAQDAVYQTMLSNMRRSQLDQARLAGRLAAAVTGAGLATVYLVAASFMD
ncbi:hypothetical protein K1X12_03745 [Hyphomonas sp. WL0036]|uniref:hypothetical protein n=1 Tax=Hyphomonas sediminis TaxID=2866160 RepID=UPI001C7E4336|nr:hypothetical protein [Hyphomonas sediminis]MBY9065995.1 hypothetical protein [Hyphomonas sediminis]